MGSTLQTPSQLPAPGREPLPLNASRPHISKQSIPFCTASAAATRARPPPRRLRTPASPGRGAEPAANRAAAAQYRGAAHTITAPQDRRHGAGVGCARQPPHSGPGAPLEEPRGPRVQASPPPPRSVPLTRPPPRPSPLRPGRSRLPARPPPQPRREAPRASPLPGTPQVSRPLTAAQRPAAATGGSGVGAGTARSRGIRAGLRTWAGGEGERAVGLGE